MNNMQQIDQGDDEEQKVIAINALAENYGKTFSEELLNLWLDLLANYSALQVKCGIKNVLEKYEFKTFPPFAVLKKALNDLSGTSDKALELQAMAEWGMLLEVISEQGFYNKPKLHLTTEYVLRIMGGWQAVCGWQTSDLDFKSKLFIKYWVEAHGRVEIMQLGAGAVYTAIRIGQERNNRPLAIGVTMPALFTSMQQ